jgi:Xaa-Pro aminopeptidase
MTLPLLGFPPATFSRRRERVLAQLRGGVLLLPSAPLLLRSRGTEHRYRPDSELFYLTGSTEPGVVALLRGQGEGDRFVLFVPGRDPAAELWSGRRLGPRETGERLGADAAYPAEEMGDRLPELLRGASVIHFRLGVHPALEPMVVEALEQARRRGARRGAGPRGVMDPGEVLDDLRLRKDPEEVSRLRRAAELTVSSFREAMACARPGMGEWEVESVLESGFRRGGARGPAFPTIVGSGRNACVLHYSANQSVLPADEMVLLDGGAEVDLYAADVTRTFPPGGHFTGPQRDVYEVVLRGHGAALAAIRPGARVEEVHREAVAELTRGLVELGILSGNAEELVEQRAYERYFPHQTSHWLGLDLHDVGDYVVDGVSRVLEPGMVLTVEPGLYFSEARAADARSRPTGWMPDSDPRPGTRAAPSAATVPGPAATPFDGIGVRIEDDVLVTPDGAENLTGALPVDPGEVEALSGSRA